MFKRSGGFITMQVTRVWITWLIKSSRYVFTISCLLLVCYMCSWSVTLMSPRNTGVGLCWRAESVSVVMRARFMKLLLPQRPAARFSFRGQQRIIIQWPPHLLRLRMRGGDQSWFWCFLHHINEGRSGFCHQAWNQTSTNQRLLTAIFHKHLKQNSLICLFPVLMSDGLTAGCESVMSPCFSVCRHSFSLFHGPECNVASERSDKVKKLPEFKNLAQIFLFMWKEIKKYRTLFPFPQTNEQSVTAISIRASTRVLQVIGLRPSIQSAYMQLSWDSTDISWYHSIVN